jgi:serine/threonine protein kinase
MLEHEWDLVFELAERLAGEPAETQRSTLKALGLSEPIQAAILRQIRLGEPPADPPFGSRQEHIGPWITLRRHLCEGGAGAVYLGTHTRAGTARPAAVKLLRVPRSESGRARLEQTWSRELHWLRELSPHGLTPAFLEGGEHTAADGSRFYYLCTEYKPGLGLRAWCEKRALVAAERIHLFLQLCDRVGALHAHGLVHGDLKPANLQVQRQREGAELWILDLGVAVAQGQPWHWSSGLVGTPGYMSPEQVREPCAGDSAIGPQADVYALGVILFELLERRRWLECPGVPTAGELEQRMREQGSPRLVRLAPRNLREPLNRVLRWATARDPQRRCPEVGPLRAAVFRALQSGASPSCPPTRRRRGGSAILAHAESG